MKRCSPIRAVYPSTRLPCSRHRMVRECCDAWSDRRMPDAKRGTRSALLHADLKLDLPSAVRSAVLHQELEISKLGHARIDDAGDRLPLGKSFNRRQHDFDFAGLLEFALRIWDDLARCVPAA